MNYDSLLDIVIEEGKLSKKELLHKARCQGIFRPHDALRYLERTNFVQITRTAEGEIVSYNQH